MSKIQEQAVSERPVDDLLAEWEGQKKAMYRLHERDVAYLIEANRCVSTIATNLGNLMQRIAGRYVPTEGELERDAKGYGGWIQWFERVWELSPDELFTKV